MHGPAANCYSVPRLHSVRMITVVLVCVCVLLLLLLLFSFLFLLLTCFTQRSVCTVSKGELFIINSIIYLFTFFFFFEVA